MFASSIIVIPGSAGVPPAVLLLASKPSDYFRNPLGSQVLVIPIPDLHCWRGPARTQTFSYVPTELSIRRHLPSFDFQLTLDLVDTRVHAHQPAAHVFADVDVI